jgi:hypothetical protein
LAISPWLVIIFSFAFFWKSRSQPHHLILSYFILVSNVSIVVSDYFNDGLVVTYTAARTDEIYSTLINVMLLFISIVAIYYKGYEQGFHDKSNLKINDNLIIYSIMIGVLSVIIMTGITNTGDLSKYSVSVASYYSYGIIAILLAYVNSGSSKLRKNILYLLSIIFVFQDLIYGGRKSLFELSILFLLIKYKEKITPIRLILVSIIGYIAYVATGLYRVNYNIDAVSISNIMNELINRKFVFDTPVGAYYASATHIFASSYFDLEFKFSSFGDFIKQVFLGGSNGSGNLTLFISQNLSRSMGGGVMPSHFFFWFGWIGVFIIAVIIVRLLNIHLNNEYKKYFSIIFVCTVTNWYLYTPLVLFREAVLAVFMAYILSKIINQITSRYDPLRHKNVLERGSK